MVRDRGQPAALSGSQKSKVGDQAVLRRWTCRIAGFAFDRSDGHPAIQQ